MTEKEKGYSLVDRVLLISYHLIEGISEPTMKDKLAAFMKCRKEEEEEVSFFHFNLVWFLPSISSESAVQSDPLCFL